MDLKGRRCIVTGATSGIGRATAHTLAARGATVGLLCRDPDKGARTLEELRRETGNSDLRLYRADLASQSEIRAVAAEILADFETIHLLINNAGVVNLRHSLTPDGIETVFAVNHLAYFLLTNLLLERLRASAPARIVNVASHAHRFVTGIDFEDPGRQKDYRSMAVYGQSKLANILFTRELARRLRGTGVTVNAVHPGAVATNLATNNGGWATALMRTLSLFFNSPKKGAATSLYAATDPRLETTSGEYFAKCRPATIAQAGLDDNAGARLWALSEQLTAPSHAAPESPD